MVLNLCNLRNLWIRSVHLVSSPHSRDNTWDAIGGSFGPDVKFVNRALELVFEMLGNAGD